MHICQIYLSINTHGVETTRKGTGNIVGCTSARRVDWSGTRCDGANEYGYHSLTARIPSTCEPPARRSDDDWSQKDCEPASNTQKRDSRSRPHVAALPQRRHRCVEDISLDTESPSTPTATADSPEPVECAGPAQIRDEHQSTSSANPASRR